MVINDLLESVTFEPEATLVIGETEELFFGHLFSLDVDHRGYIYAADRQQNHINVYDAEGSLLQTVGRQGRGPGEFQSLIRLIVRADTLWAYDNQQLQISAFVRETGDIWELQNTITISRLGSQIPADIRKTETGFIVENLSMFTEEGIHGWRKTLSLIDNNGNSLNEEVISYVQTEMLFENGRSYMNPFYPATREQVGPSDIIYVGKSDSLRVTGYNLNGERVEELKRNIRYRPITSRDIDREDLSSDNPVRNHAPDHHPAFINFLIDENNRYWFNLGELDEETDTWVSLNAEGSVEASIKLPQAFSVRKIQSGKAYGIYRDEDGAESIMVYDVDARVL